MVRIECADCDRFLSWESPPAPQPPGGEGGDSPLSPLWLYASKRLDLDWLPNAPLWSAPVVVLGTVPYYRLTARVLAWLETAGSQLERGALAGTVDPAQVAAYLAAMTTVWAFAQEHLPLAEVSAARRQPPSLPDPPYLPNRPGTPG